VNAEGAERRRGKCGKGILLCALLVISGLAAEPGKITKEQIDFAGKKRGYSLFVPAGSTEAAPLVVLLHGSGRNGLSQVERWKDLAAKEGIILAGPDALTPSAWQPRDDGPAFLHALVEKLKAGHRIDGRRVYLFGHSAGAEHALMMALLESEYFAAAAIHAGALRPEEFRIIDYATRKTPMQILVGTKDQYFPLPLVRGTHEALKAKGFEVKYREIAGHDHNYYARAVEINREAWEFLRGQKLEKDPQYTEYR
jgi:poly(3-hydroxybutyrate) depolymerase